MKLYIENQKVSIKRLLEEIPWRFRGYDSVLSLQQALVQSLVKELRFCKLCGVAKKEKLLEKLMNPLRKIYVFSRYKIKFQDTKSTDKNLLHFYMLIMNY